MTYKAHEDGLREKKVQNEMFVIIIETSRVCHRSRTGETFASAKRRRSKSISRYDMLRYESV